MAFPFTFPLTPALDPLAAVEKAAAADTLPAKLEEVEALEPEPEPARPSEPSPEVINKPTEAHLSAEEEAKTQEKKKRAEDRKRKEEEKRKAEKERKEEERRKAEEKKKKDKEEDERRKQAKGGPPKEKPEAVRLYVSFLSSWTPQSSPFPFLLAQQQSVYLSVVHNPDHPVEAAVSTAAMWRRTCAYWRSA